MLTIITANEAAELSTGNNKRGDDIIKYLSHEIKKRAALGSRTYILPTKFFDIPISIIEGHWLGEVLRNAGYTVQTPDEGGLIIYW